jgi:hypothetical protein
MRYVYLKRVHGSSVCAFCLEDPCSDIHERAKGLREEDEDGAFVSDPQGAKYASPAAAGSGGGGRLGPDSTTANESSGAL